MERNAFERTQGYLDHLVRYLEGLSTSMEWDIDEAPHRNAYGMPARLARVLVDSGQLEGLHLKSQGILSQELQEFIVEVGFAFEVAVVLPGPFKLPFVDNEAVIQRKTLNPFMEKAWAVYHSALLSAYAMRPLRFEKVGDSADGMEASMRVREAPPEGSQDSSAMSPETVHYLNNALMGITSYVSLILGERKDDPDLASKLELVLEAARKAAASAQPPSGEP
ncbi:MAG TPA: hypothetical protein VK465_05245 [Fibrobacteria bacterium]|nr:hypothetical protein [Fibrobacteria bacterium]